MVGEGPTSSDPERLLAELGASLGARLVAAVPGWVVREVERIMEAWDASVAPSADQGRDGRPSVERVVVRMEAEDAGRRAAEDVDSRLRALLSAGVDGQSTTPLEIMRSAVVYPTGVLRRAGVAGLVRDPFDETRFPDDDYGLTPASLGAVDPSLTEPARDWGAAKAMAHKARHGGQRA